MTKNNFSNLFSRDAGSFRDPSGFIFTKDGLLYRQVNQAYAKTFDTLMTSGLYAELTRKGYLVAHEEVIIEEAMKEGAGPDAYKIIKPERIPFISYPYEWCFSELKDAALLTLKIQKIALRFGMTLKDASAYNIQFKNGKPIMIDTLSFEIYPEGAPWVAYRQFCRHFLAPLALMSFKDVRLGQLARSYIDGIPLDLAARLLPRRSLLSPGIFFHIHAQSRSEAWHEKSAATHGGAAGSDSASGVGISAPRSANLGPGALKSILDSLTSAVSKLAWSASSLSESTVRRSLSDETADAIVRFVEAEQPKLIWDCSAGVDGAGFPWDRCATNAAVVALSADYALIEKKYHAGFPAESRTLALEVLPLVIDFANPSPGGGWAGEERTSLIERGPADVLVAFDWIHRVAIGNNVPFGMLAEFLASVCHSLVIEFVPKEDPTVRKLLIGRKNIFADYTLEAFEKEFGRHFTIRGSHETPESGRVTYCMIKK